MTRIVAYVDGFNLYYGIRDSGFKWLNIEALVRAYLDATDTLTAVNYFTAHVKGTPADPDAPLRQQVYLRAVGTLPLVTCHYGKFTRWTKLMPLAAPIASLRPVPDRVQVLKVEEKGSDVALGSQLVADAYEGRFDTALVVSNDTDLCPPIRLVQAKGLAVGILNPRDNRGAPEMRQVASFYKQVRASVLAGCQFPDPVIDARVGRISKPIGPGW